MNIKKIDSGILHSCMYIIEENKHAIVIDPCKCVDYAEGLIIDYIIITHEHYDHISGVNEWKKTTGAPLLCSKVCAENIKDPKKNMSRYFEAFCMIQTWIPTEQIEVKNVEDYTCEADKTFEGETVLEWQKHKITLFELLGHSKGSIGIYVDNADFFSGDSLMRDYDVELRLPGGSDYEWKISGKKKIEAIPEGTMIWPGHFDNYIMHKHIKSE